MGGRRGAVTSIAVDDFEHHDPGLPAVRTERLSKHYGTAPALDGLDLEIRRGEVFGYLGPNGAGKSTTIGLLLGFLRPTAGTASVLGFDPWRQAPALHRHLAYVPSEAALWPNLTGQETLELLARLHGSVDAPYRADLIERFELDQRKAVRDLSHGNRQKVLLIGALASRAELLLLDEPTTGLDPLMEQVFQHCVREARDNGQTVLLSSHILSQVEAVSDRVAMLRSGRLIDVGDLDVLRHMASLRVEAHLEQPPEPTAHLELAALAGVSNVEVDDRHLTCEVSGSMRPLLDAVAPYGILRITTREPSLEEIFIAHYGAIPG